MNQTELTALLLTERATWEYIGGAHGKFHILGGKGSGHFGHGGIPGHRGGSAPRSGGVGQAPVRYPPGTKMPDNPPVMETRPFLFFGSPVTKHIRATEEEQGLISEAFESLNVPGYVGRHPEVWLSMDTRKGEQLGLTSGRATYVNPKIIHDRELLRSTIAHEVSHIVLRNAPGNKIEKRFEGAFGKGPYPKGRLGIDSVYHLQNSSEMLSKLFANHLIGKEVPMSVQGFIGWEFYQGQPWGEIKLSEPSLHLALSEHPTIDSYISYLIEEDYHFRTNGQQVVVLGSAKSGHWGHKGILGKQGGSLPGGAKRLPQPWQNGVYGDIAELVPVAEMEKYQEHMWTRRYHPRLSQAEYDDLSSDIRTNGFKEPIILDYNPSNKYAQVIEGNHRLSIARDLGLKYIPARLVRSRYLDSGDRGASLVDKPKIIEGHVPGDMSPSMVFRFAEHGFTPCPHITNEQHVVLEM